VVELSGRGRIGTHIEWRRSSRSKGRRRRRRSNRKVRSRKVDGIPGIVGNGVRDLIPSTVPKNSRRMRSGPRSTRPKRERDAARHQRGDEKIRKKEDAKRRENATLSRRGGSTR